MSRKEIELKLQAGKCPVKLSIEHWEHNREIVEIDWVLTFEDTGSDSCALCIFNDMHDSDCSRCELTRVTGVSCSRSSSLWWNIRGRMHRGPALNTARSVENKRELLEAIDELLDALHEAESLESTREKGARI